MNEARHAFLIMAHKNPQQLRTLLSLLDHSRVDIYIHIDKKSRGFHKEELCDALQASRVYFVEPMNVVWGSALQIECEFRLLEAALPKKYAYYHLLSGLDLPLKKMDEILAFFDQWGDREFVSFESRSVSSSAYERASLFWPFQSVRFCRKFFLFLQQKGVALQRRLGVDRLKNKQIQLYKGANWFSCTHGYLSLLVRDKAALLKLFRHSFCADELFLQTHLMTTSFQDHLFDDSFSDSPRAFMRLIDWQRGNPYTFRTEDIELLLNSEFLFARKFDEGVDPEIIQSIAEHLKA